MALATAMLQDRSPRVTGSKGFAALTADILLSISRLGDIGRDMSSFIRSSLVMPLGKEPMIAWDRKFEDMLPTDCSGVPPSACLCTQSAANLPSQRQ